MLEYIRVDYHAPARLSVVRGGSSSAALQKKQQSKCGGGMIAARGSVVLIVPGGRPHPSHQLITPTKQQRPCLRLRAATPTNGNHLEDAEQNVTPHNPAVVDRPHAFARETITSRKTSARSSSILDLKQLHLEDEGGVRGDHRREAPCTVREILRQGRKLRATATLRWRAARLARTGVQVNFAFWPLLICITPAGGRERSA